MCQYGGVSDVNMFHAFKYICQILCVDMHVCLHVPLRQPAVCLLKRRECLHSICLCAASDIVRLCVCVCVCTVWIDISFNTCTCKTYVTCLDM